MNCRLFTQSTVTTVYMTVMSPESLQSENKQFITNIIAFVKKKKTFRTFAN